MGRLAFSLNADGTVTLSCDADRFFAHADEIRRLLAGDGDRAPVAMAPPLPGPRAPGQSAAPGASAPKPAPRRRRRARPGAVGEAGPTAAQGAAPAHVCLEDDGPARHELDAIRQVADAPTLPPVRRPRVTKPARAAEARAEAPADEPALGPFGAGPSLDEAPGSAPASEGATLGQDVHADAGAPPLVDAGAVRAFWTSVFGDGPPRGSRDLSARGTTIVAAASFLARTAPARAVHADDLLAVLRAATGPAAAPIPSATLAHLARRGWLDRAARGAYRTTRRGEDRVASLRDARRRPARARAAPPVSLPRLVGLSRFLRAVPAQRKWRRVLLVCYFLAEHCGVPEVDQRVLQAVFLRLRGIEAPGSLAALLSQTLCKRLGLLEPGSRRGLYRLAAKSRDDLRRQPRVAAADQAQRTQSGSVTRTG